MNLSNLVRVFLIPLTCFDLQKAFNSVSGFVWGFKGKLLTAVNKLVPKRNAVFKYDSLFYFRKMELVLPCKKSSSQRRQTMEATPFTERHQLKMLPVKEKVQTFRCTKVYQVTLNVYLEM